LSSGDNEWIINDVVRANSTGQMLPLLMLAAVAFFLQHGFNALRIVLNNSFEQKSDLRFAQRFGIHNPLLLCGGSTIAPRRPDDTRDRGRQLGRARVD